MPTNHGVSFTCRDILLIPDFKEAVILAGAGGMQRSINRVNVMEVPDVIDWVRAGEFLITSGFPFRDQPEAIADMVPQLAEKGVAALGIKTKRFIDEIPQRALELADELDFPIIELPAMTSFSDVVRDIMERVLVTEARELSLLQSRFQRLSQQLLYGKGIEEFLHTLDAMLNNPIILLDDSNQLFLSPQAEQFVPILNSSIWSELRIESNLGVSFITVGDRRIRVYVSEINDKQHDKSFLVLLEWNQEHTVVDQLTIDRVGILVGLEMINANARKEVELKYIDQFLQDWITGRIVTTEDLKLRAEASGTNIEEKQQLYVVLVRWLDVKPTLKQLQQASKRLRGKILHHELQVTIIEGELVFLASYQSQLAQQITLEQMVTNLKAIFGIDTFSLCTGHVVNRSDNVHESYGDAKKIQHISTICSYDERFVDYKQLGVFRLLYHLPDSDAVRSYRDQFVAPIVDYDRKHQSQLYETIQTYFKHNRNVKKTAAELITHYNTVSYRIDRVCELLQIRSDQGDDFLELFIAIKLNEMRPIGL